MNQLLIIIAETARSCARAKGVDCHAGLHLRPHAHERASGRGSGSRALHEVREEDMERMGRGRLTHTHTYEHTPTLTNTNAHYHRAPARIRARTVWRVVALVQKVPCAIPAPVTAGTRAHVKEVGPRGSRWRENGRVCAPACVIACKP